MFSLIQKALKKEKGMLDLASIITGAVITGILGAVTAASFIVIIPWFQEKAAQDDVNLIKVAQESHYSDKGSYGDLAALDASNYLHKIQSTTACVALSSATNAASYTIYVKSKNNKIFRYTPSDVKATIVAGATVIPTTTPVACK